MHTLVETARPYRTGELSPVDVVDECLAAIDAHEADVRAWVLIDREGARAAAREAAARFQRGEDPGPLAGIPVGIKDLIDVAGWPTLAGSRTRAGHIAATDAPLITRLKQAGAILLGKTVTTEFACFDPPVTRNPWNLGHTPGGSSSGSAAAVAAGMCLAAIGTQTGGSITRPASFCGIAACKPTLARVSTAGIVPLSTSLDHPGPLAKCVADVAAVLAVIADDGADLASWLSPGPTRETSPPPELIVIEPYFLEYADTASKQPFHTAIDRLSAAGARVSRGGLLPSFDQVHTMHRRLMAAEAAAYHRAPFTADRAAYGPAISGWLDEGLALPAVDYLSALEHRAIHRQELAAAFAARPAAWWIVPAAVGPAPTPETTGDPRFNSPWSYAGVPSVSFPYALSGSGLPLGMQLIGPAWSENELLSAAAWCEGAMGFNARPTFASTAASFPVR